MYIHKHQPLFISSVLNALFTEQYTRIIDCLTKVHYGLAVCFKWLLRLDSSPFFFHSHVQNFGMSRFVLFFFYSHDYFLPHSVYNHLQFI